MCGCESGQDATQTTVIYGLRTFYFIPNRCKLVARDALWGTLEQDRFVAGLTIFAERKEIEMKSLLFGMAMAGLAGMAHADTVEFNGVLYETIDWTSASSATNTASGSAAGVGVTFETVDVSYDSITQSDFLGADGFDALNFDTGLVESITIMGGVLGTSTLRFDQSVDSVLVLIGSPNDTSTFTQLGAAIWTFDQGLDLELIDSEGAPGLTLTSNILSNAIGPEVHQSGVLGITGESFMELSWEQGTSAGLDQTMITFAIASNEVPAPASGLALLLPAAFAGRRRR